jgi:hypothetical protein
MQFEGLSVFDVVGGIKDPQTLVNTNAIITNAASIVTNSTAIAESNTRVLFEIERVRDKTGTMEALHQTTSGASSFLANDSIAQNGSNDIFFLGCGFRPADVRNPVSKVTTTVGQQTPTIPIGILAVPDFKPLITFNDLPYALYISLVPATVDRLYSIKVEFDLDFLLTGGGLPSGNQRLTFQTFVQIIGRNSAGVRLLNKTAFALSSTITNETQPQKRRHNETFTFVVSPDVARIELVPTYNNSSTLAVPGLPQMTCFVSSDDVQKCQLKATVLNLSSFAPL